MGYRGSYVALIKDGEVLNEKINNDDPAELGVEEISIPGIERILSAGYDPGNESIIEVNGRNESINWRGMNIVILANNLEVIRSFPVDTSQTDIVFPGVYKAEPIDPVADASGLTAAPN